MKVWSKGLITLVILLNSFVATAQSQWCTGTINRTYIGSDGTVYLNGSWRNDYTAICNLNVARSGATPETCKGWLSFAVAAKMSQTPVIAYYSNTNTTCDQLTTYKTAPPLGYLMLSK